MKNKKIIAYSLVAFTFSLLFIGSASASLTLLLDQPTAAASQALALGGIYGWGHAFQGNNQYLSQFDVRLDNTTAKVGSAVAYLYQEPSLTAKNDSAPVLDTSNTLNLQSYASASYLMFTFSETVLLESSKYYCVVMIFEEDVSGTINGKYVVAGSNVGRYVSGADVRAVTNNAATCRVYTESSAAPTPTPTPTPIPTALSFTLDMRGVGAVTNPSSTTSASGKEWFPKQGLGYAFYGHVWNYTNPYCNGAYTAYATIQRHKSLGNQTADSWADLAADDVTEVTSGTLSNGYFNLGVSCQSQVNSVEIYQGWRINGTVTGSSDTFTIDFLTRWTEQGVVIIEPTGSTGLPTPTPSGYIPVSYGYIVWYIVALIVVLLPAGILGVLFRFGAWGFIIGLAIGAGLGYMLMPTIVPLWLVFVVVIGIVGMLLKNTVLGGSGGEKTI